ncbi:MAG: ACP S-malonyltransferase [Deltaproteobacteria bacterium]|nr:ACP S-malonyltransferase [Deltaproteobacteria bacterium]
MPKTAFLFPGQGSQGEGMGKDFFDAHDWAKDIFNMADEVTGKPITRLCFEGPMDELTQTVNLQPAMTAMDLVCLKALREKGITPGAVAGHSLGEYTALAAAGVITEADCLNLVNKRGELMQAAADKNPGAMQAIIGLNKAQVEEITNQARNKGLVQAANLNTPEQIVITGEADAVAVAGELATAQKARAVPLAVSGAWHSPLMETAAREFAQVLEEIAFSAPTCELYLNVTGQAEIDPARIKSIMSQQITSSVRWYEIIENMLKSGVTGFVEVGPKRTLAGFNRKIVPKGSEAKTLNVADIPGVDKAVEALTG